MRLHTRIEKEIILNIFRHFPTGYMVTKDGSLLPENSGNDIDILVEDFETASKYVYDLLSRRNEVFELVTTTNMSRFLIETDSTKLLELDIFYQLGKKWIPILEFKNAHLNIKNNPAGIKYLGNDNAKALSVVKDFCTYGFLREKNKYRNGGAVPKYYFQIISNSIRKTKVYDCYINNGANRFKVFGFVRLSYLINPILILKYVNRYYRTRRLWEDHYSKKNSGEL